MAVQTEEMASGHKLRASLQSSFDLSIMEFGLQTFDGYKHREMQFRYKNNALTAMLLDSSDQQSINCSNNGQNVGTIEQNIILASSTEEGTRKKQKMEHKTTGPRIDVSFEDILKCSKMSPNHAARKLKVSISRFKGVCRGFGICGWPPTKTSSSVGNYIKPGLQDVANMVTIKAKSPTYTLKFRLPSSSTLEDLKQEVAKRSMDKSTIVVLLEPEQPITNLNPTD
ncbi:hypothetical protein Vadar_004009 [Vaccinium darrowii]|uniref:Uncharacterized protein n=1 Tax=Vaccinium darrowii TaxID=229202 RepID=A0ACB7XFB9_9ERIC|nr:hypothetical protein Vadar_004009 [Vaccinium darrowii]